ncbi:helix-turn-helix domain-containing protein [Spartinivicinus ruber]|uniref:helix-turn-helix domain-containing protein n=1 Tax=Spartinivicinus ruber TaxID=2683272 RepID=UPI0013D61CCD|nr:helix-turn-helix transcriptional regulator [Spartinivicinus ruber]
MAELWQKLRARRRELDLTQREVASFCGVSHGAVAQWEAKNPETRVIPRKKALNKLSEILEVDTDWFFDDSIGLTNYDECISDVEEDDYIESKTKAENYQTKMQVLVDLNSLLVRDKLTDEDVKILRTVVDIATNRKS